MKPKNAAAQEMARLSHAGPTSAKRSENARENGKKGGRPPKPATAMLIRNAEGEWSLYRWKGDIFPTKNFTTASAAREWAKSKGFGVKRMPDCDS